MLTHFWHDSEINQMPMNSTNTVYNWSGSKIKSGSRVKQCPSPVSNVFTGTTDVITFTQSACF